MSDNKSKLDRQINVFLAVRGHDHQMVDWWQVTREIMEEVNYWRVVAKHPGEVDRPRGGQKKAEMDRLTASARLFDRSDRWRIERPYFGTSGFGMRF
ncbi:hypothetical protein OAR83_03145 [Alphaproteobacteria bacterium]|nr:hypothetical protein [Alphaproteobacteria bacterium]